MDVTHIVTVDRTIISPTPLHPQPSHSRPKYNPINIQLDAFAHNIKIKPKPNYSEPQRYALLVFSTP
ncbi:hypothetical protein BDZ91DRAFT_736064 [Kalaharituber pfeilii]|nr:hypothetical protein BDZ91DRAFT_736064 [Kalaharituber pfeilii]